MQFRFLKEPRNSEYPIKFQTIWNLALCEEMLLFLKEVLIVTTTNCTENHRRKTITLKGSLTERYFQVFTQGVLMRNC